MTWRIDPTTGDSTLDAGHWERDDGLTTPVYLRLFTQRGSYLEDGAFGSRLHELVRDSPATAAKKLPGMVKEALQPLLEDHRVTSLEVVAEVQGSQVVAQVILMDAGQQQYQFRIWQEVG